MSGFSWSSTILKSETFGTKKFSLCKYNNYMSWHHPLMCFISWKMINRAMLCSLYIKWCNTFNAERECYYFLPEFESSWDTSCTCIAVPTSYGQSYFSLADMNVYTASDECKHTQSISNNLNPFQQRPGYDKWLNRFLLMQYLGSPALDSS